MSPTRNILQIFLCQLLLLFSNSILGQKHYEIELDPIHFDLISSCNLYDTFLVFNSDQELKANICIKSYDSIDFKTHSAILVSQGLPTYKSKLTIKLFKIQDENLYNLVCTIVVGDKVASPATIAYQLFSIQKLKESDSLYYTIVKTP